MSNEDSPYIWVPEVCQFANPSDCMDAFPEPAAALVVSHIAYEAIAKERDQLLQERKNLLEELERWKAKDELSAKY